MPSVQTRTPEQVHKRLKERLDEKLSEQKPLESFAPPEHARVTITGRVKKLDGPQTVELDEQFCLVILPKKVAKHYGMVDSNSDWDLCIWDPVTGSVRCTQNE